MISVSIMAVPDRMDNVNRMVASLLDSGMPQEMLSIALDEERKGPAYTNRRAWQSHHPEATHHIVLQDDIELCTDFYKGLLELIKARPEHILNLFCYSRKVVGVDHTAWGVSKGYLWAQAVLLPVPLISEYLQWARDHVREDYKHDDGIMALWMLHTKRLMWISIPSLVEHLDDEYKSLMNHNGWGRRRVASRYIGDASPLYVDWSRGVDNPLKLTSYSISAFKKGRWWRPELAGDYE